MNLWIGLALIAIGAVAWIVVMPWARRLDAQKADQRQAAGKSRSSTPQWVVIALIAAMIVAGSILWSMR